MNELEYNPSEYVLGASAAKLSSYRADDGRYVAVHSHCLPAERTLKSAPMATRAGAKRALHQALLRAGWLGMFSKISYYDHTTGRIVMEPHEQH